MSVKNLHWRLQRSTRQAKDRDDFGFDLPGRVLGGTISQTMLSPEKCAHFCSTAIYDCSFATGYAWKSEFADTCGRAKMMLCGYVVDAETCENEKTVRVFKSIPDTCGRGLNRIGKYPNEPRYRNFLSNTFGKVQIRRSNVQDPGGNVRRIQPHWTFPKLWVYNNITW